MNEKWKSNGQARRIKEPLEEGKDRGLTSKS